MRLAVLAILLITACGTSPTPTQKPSPSPTTTETPLATTPETRNPAPSATPSATNTASHTIKPRPTLPPVDETTATPNPNLTVRQRVDRYWARAWSVECMWQVASLSLDEVAEQADVIVIGRPTGARLWDDPPYLIPDQQSLINIDVSRVIEGESLLNGSPKLDIYMSTGVPPGTLTDVDHLLFLVKEDRDSRVFRVGEWFMGIYADDHGKVVVPEYATTKRAYGNHAFNVALDGTSFADLVDRVEDIVGDASANRSMMARTAYFAC